MKIYFRSTDDCNDDDDDVEINWTGDSGWVEDEDGGKGDSQDLTNPKETTAVQKLINKISLKPTFAKQV